LSSKDDFASLMEQSTTETGARRTGRRVRVGEFVEGTVVQIGRDWIFVDIGGTSEARIERSELADAKGHLQLDVGHRLRASVAKLGEEGPLLALSVGRGSRGGVDLSQLKEAREGRLPVQGKVTRAVKAGVEVDVAGIRAFCPASQLDAAYVADLASFEGRTLDFLVSDVKDDGRSVVLSRRALLEEEKARAQKSVLERISVGGEYEGKVTSLMKYGAFIDLGGGVEGLVHVSEIAHTRVDRVEDALNVGDTVTVKVLAVEPQDKSPVPKLRLSIKALSHAPELPRVAPDEVLAGTVAKVGSFGVRVSTPKGEGLVPMRELGVPRGSDHR
jgi:small subunit ribosomal protein S1